MPLFLIISTYYSIGGKDSNRVRRQNILCSGLFWNQNVSMVQEITFNTINNLVLFTVAEGKHSFPQRLASLWEEWSFTISTSGHPNMACKSLTLAGPSISLAVAWASASSSPDNSWYATSPSWVGQKRSLHKSTQKCRGLYCSTALTYYSYQ